MPMPVLSPRDGRARSRSPQKIPMPQISSRVARSGRFTAKDPAKLVLSTAAVPPQKGRIGILGGSGPEAGLDLFKKVLAANRRVMGDNYRGDQDAPNVVVNSQPKLAGPHGTFDMDPCLKREGNLWEALNEAVHQIAPQVDYFCICCNTLHYVAPPMLAMMKEEGIKARFVSIMEAVGVYCRRHGIGAVRVLGSLVTTDVGATGKSPYRDLQEQGLALGEHTYEQRELQQKAINMIKTRGPENEEARKMMQDIVDVAGTIPIPTGTQEETLPQGLLLSCTEMPLVRHVLKGPGNVQLLDPTLILAEYLVSLSHNSEKLGH